MHRTSRNWSWKSVLATTCGNLFLVFGTLVLATLALVFGWIPPRGNIVFLVARLWSRGLLWSSGVRAVSRFAVPLDFGTPYIFMANHRSLFDIPALIASLPGQTRFMAKRSLFRIPVFGWAIKLGGFVTIDRHDLSSARGSFAEAVSRIRSGVSVLVFPEGTRATGATLLPFQRGGFLLAQKSGTAIVPVGIAGSGEVQRKAGLRIQPGIIRVHYGDPVSVGDFPVSRRAELMSLVRDRIEALIEKPEDPVRGERARRSEVNGDGK